MHQEYLRAPWKDANTTAEAVGDDTTRNRRTTLLRAPSLSLDGFIVPIARLRSVGSPSLHLSWQLRISLFECNLIANSNLMRRARALSRRARKISSRQLRSSDSNERVEQCIRRK